MSITDRRTPVAASRKSSSWYTNFLAKVKEIAVVQKKNVAQNRVTINIQKADTDNQSIVKRTESKNKWLSPSPGKRV